MLEQLANSGRDIRREPEILAVRLVEIVGSNCILDKE